MKNLLLSLIILFFAVNSYAQDFAPIGSTWYYTEGYAFSGDVDYLKIESVKDSIVGGKLCKLLKKTDYLFCTRRQNDELVYAQDSTIYFWDTEFNEFQILYSFKTKVDSSWTIKIKSHTNETEIITVTVNSKTIKKVLNKDYEVLNVTYSTDPLMIDDNFHYTSQILYPFGDINYLFNLYLRQGFKFCDSNYSVGLRCYEDPIFGQYSSGIADSCTYTYKWTNMNDFTNEVLKPTLYPNPVNEDVQIEFADNSTYKYSLMDYTGRLLERGTFIGKKTIVLSAYSGGIYFITTENERGLQFSNKFVKM